MMMNRKKQIQIEKKSKDNDLKKLARLSEKKVMINYQTGPMV